MNINQWGYENQHILMLLSLMSASTIFPQLQLSIQMISREEQIIQDFILRLKFLLRDDVASLVELMIIRNHHQKNVKLNIDELFLPEDKCVREPCHRSKRKGQEGLSKLSPTGIMVG